MSDALNIIQDPTLTYHQELLALARLGESTDDSLRYSDAYYEAKRKGALCDLNEGVMSKQGLTKAIEAVSQPQNKESLGTAWTMVMDLKNPSVTYYSRRHFNKPFTFKMSRGE